MSWSANSCGERWRPPDGGLGKLVSAVTHRLTLQALRRAAAMASARLRSPADPMIAEHEIERLASLLSGVRRSVDAWSGRTVVVYLPTWGAVVRGIGHEREAVRDAAARARVECWI